MQSKLIPDSAITASSTLVPTTLLYAPGNARLHYTGGIGRYGGWIPAVSDHSQWLQINFESDRHVTGIATQGYHQRHYYVKSYTLQYVDDRDYLQQYQPEWHTKVSTMCNVVSFYNITQCNRTTLFPSIFPLFLQEVTYSIVNLSTFE